MVVLGGARDSHHLTGWAWRIMASACGRPAQCLHIANLALFAALAGVLTFTVSIRNNRNGILPALLCGFALTASPFAAGLITDPLGGEGSIALMLFAFLAMDAMRSKVSPVVLQSAVSVALVLQDVRFAPSVLLYAFMRGAAADTSGRERLVGIGAAVIAIGASLALHTPQYYAAAASEIVIVAGIMLFLILPLALYASKVGVYRSLGWGCEGSATVPLLMGGLTLAMGLFASRELTPTYFMAAEIALLTALVASASAERLPQIWAGLAVAAFMFAGVASVAAAPTPALANARQANAVRRAIAQDRSKLLCVLTDATSSEYINDGFSRMYDSGSHNVVVRQSISECKAAIGTANAGLLEARDAKVFDWGNNGIPLGLAAEAAGGATAVFGGAPGQVFPKTNTRLPGHHGAFESRIRTPVGNQPTLTIVAGYGYRFDCLHLPKRAVLSFAFGNPIADTPGADPVRLVVNVVTNGIRQVQMTRDLQPVQRPKAPPWFYYRKQLHLPQGCTDITFRAVPYTGKARATWITLVAPSFR